MRRPPNGQLLPSGTTDRKEVPLFCFTLKLAPYCWAWGWQAVLVLEALSLCHTSALWLPLQNSQESNSTVSFVSTIKVSNAISADPGFVLQSLWNPFLISSPFHSPSHSPSFPPSSGQSLPPLPLSHLPLVPLFLPLPILFPLPSSFSFLWIAAYIN